MLTKEAREALERSRAIALVDWYQEVPRALIAAGYEVGGVGADHKAKRYTVEDEKPTDTDDLFAPKDGLPGYLVCRHCATPERIDLLGTYRPPEDHLDIVTRIAIPLGAKYFWVESGADHVTDKTKNPETPYTSDEARTACAAAGITVIEGFSIPRALAELKRT